jgi:DNA sulfur modification protein DndD
MEGYSNQIGRKTENLRALEEEILALERHIAEIESDVTKLFDKHNVSKEKTAFLVECDAIATLLTQYTVRLRQNKVALLQEKTFEMYRLLSSKSGLIQDLVIDDKTYEITIRDRNGHEMRKSSLSAGEKEVFAVSLLWGLAQTSQLKLAKSRRIHRTTTRGRIPKPKIKLFVKSAALEWVCEAPDSFTLNWQKQAGDIVTKV